MSFDTFLGSKFPRLRMPTKRKIGTGWMLPLRSAEDQFSSPTPSSLFLFLLANNQINQHEILSPGILEIFKDQKGPDTLLTRFICGLEEPLRSTCVERLFPLAIKASNSKAVQALLSCGADPNQSMAPYAYYTPIGLAASLGDITTFQVLLDAKATVEVSSNEESPFHRARFFRTKEGALIQMLRGDGLAFRQSNAERPKPLSSDHFEIISVLIQSGAIISSQAMECAIKRQDISLVCHLTSISATRMGDSWISNYALTLLVVTFEYDDVLRVIKLVQDPENIRQKINPPAQPSKFGSIHVNPHVHFTGSVLDFIAFKGYLNSFRYLTTMGVQCCTSTLLHAIFGKSKPILKLLHEEGLDYSAGTSQLPWYRVLHPIGCSLEYSASTSELPWSRVLHYLGCSLPYADSWRYRNSYMFQDFMTGHEMTPVCAAILAGDPEIFSWITAKGGMYGITEDARFYPAISAASFSGQHDLVDQLLRSKVDIHGTKISEAMFEACAAGHHDIATRLFRFGPNTLETRYGHSSLLEAIKSKNHTLTTICLDAVHINELERPSAQLIDNLWQYAIEWGQHEVIESLQGVFPRCRRRIKFALQYNNVELARRFIENDERASLGHHQRYGVDFYDEVDSEYDIFECCPLSASLYHNNREISQLLISLQSDPDCVGVWMCAAEDDDVLKVILQDYKRRNGSRRTEYAAPGLMRLIKRRDIVKIEKLASVCDINQLAHVPDIVEEEEEEEEGKEDQSDNECKYSDHIMFGTESTAPMPYFTTITPFGYAILQDTTEDTRIIRLLMEAGGSLTKVATDRQDYPLLLAISTKQMAKVRLLVDAGAELNRPATRGTSRTPLQYATEVGSYEIVEFLLAKGADPNSAPSLHAGATALQFAAIQGYMEIAELLIRNGADINAPAGVTNGRTALEGAAEHGRVGMVQYLVYKGVNIQGEMSAQLDRAIQFAENGKHLGLCRYLRSLKYSTFSLT